MERFEKKNNTKKQLQFINSEMNSTQNILIIIKKYPLKIIAFYVTIRIEI